DAHRQALLSPPWGTAPGPPAAARAGAYRLPRPTAGARRRWRCCPPPAGRSQAEVGADREPEAAVVDVPAIRAAFAAVVVEPGLVQQVGAVDADRPHVAEVEPQRSVQLAGLVVVLRHVAGVGRTGGDQPGV